MYQSDVTIHMSESEANVLKGNRSTSKRVNVDDIANDHLQNVSEVKISPRKRSNSPAEMNQPNKGKMQTRSSKRKKGESSKNVPKNESCSKQMNKLSNKELENLLCQKATSSVPNSSSASNVSNIEEEMESIVPNISNNINIASTSASSCLEMASNDMSAGKLGSKKRKKSLPKWSAAGNTSDKNDSNQENSVVQNNNQEEFEEELKCSICSEIFISAVTLNCSHSFCKYCISKWRKDHLTCPICRQAISSQTSTLVLDKCVSKLLETSREEIKSHRKQVMEYRENHKEPDPPPPANPGNLIHGPSIISINAGNMLFSDDTSDEDYYDYLDYDEDDYDEDHDFFDGDGGGDYDELGDYGEPEANEQGIDHDIYENEYDEEDDYDEDEDVDAEGEEDVDAEGEEEVDAEGEEEEEEADYESVEEEEDYDEDDSYEDADGSYTDESSDSNDDRCYNCGQEGHLARNCPTRVPYTGRPGAYYGGYGTCFKCNGEGHWANGCPN